MYGHRDVPQQMRFPPNLSFGVLRANQEQRKVQQDHRYPSHTPVPQKKTEDLTHGAGGQKAGLGPGTHWAGSAFQNFLLELDLRALASQFPLVLHFLRFPHNKPSSPNASYQELAANPASAKLTAQLG